MHLGDAGMWPTTSPRPQMASCLHMLEAPAFSWAGAVRDSRSMWP